MGASELASKREKKNRKISNKISSKWRNHVVRCNIITSGFSIYLLLIHCIGKSFIMIRHSSCPCHRLFLCMCVAIFLSTMAVFVGVVGLLFYFFLAVCVFSFCQFTVYHTSVTLCTGFILLLRTNFSLNLLFPFSYLCQRCIRHRSHAWF